MATEVEAKFRARHAGPLAELSVRARLGAAQLGPPRVVDEVDRYLDTADGRLAAARWACRLRSREGTIRLSLKGPQDERAERWYHRRPEVEGPATSRVDPDGWPPSPAHELLDALRGGRPIVERLRLEQARTERRVTLADGTPIGILTLDRVRILSEAKELGDLFVVELELVPGSSAAEAELDGLAAELESIDGLIAEPRSKLEHALERLGHP